MAKGTPKRWAVRDGSKFGFNMYRIYVGSKPRKNRNGEWPDSKLERWVRWLRAELFEAEFLICLPPGGGPVAIRFADEA